MSISPVVKLKEYITLGNQALEKQGRDALADQVNAYLSENKDEIFAFRENADLTCHMNHLKEKFEALKGTIQLFLDTRPELPPEIWAHVMSFLPIRDIKRVRCVNQEFKNLSAFALVQKMNNSRISLYDLGLTQYDEVLRFTSSIGEARINVKYLQCYNIDFNSDEKFKKIIEPFENVEDLDMTCVSLNDDHLKEIGNLKHLKRLDLPGCSKLTGKGLVYLGGLSKLVSLNLSHCHGMNASGFEKINSLSVLKSLNLRELVIDNSMFSSIAKLTNLKELDLLKCRFTAARLESLKTLQVLESLVLTSTSVTDSELVELGTLTSLQELILACCPFIYDDGLRHLTNLPSLKKLCLNGTHITDAGLVHVANMVGLKSLSLSNCRKITDDGIVYLRKLTKIEELYLADTSIEEKGLLEICKLSTLRSLELEECSQLVISDLAVEQLAAMPHLKKLNLLDCNFTENGIQSLSRLKSSVDCKI